MDCVDVAVIGAGVVGLVVARALARSGREVVVIEKELGLGGEEDQELDELQKTIEASKMSDEAREKATREVTRLSRMAPMSRVYRLWVL